jgi:hypothetical protein
MLQMKEDYLAAGLRKQIDRLQQLIDEMSRETAPSKAIILQIRNIEAELHRLRDELVSLTEE